MIWIKPPAGGFPVKTRIDYTIDSLFHISRREKIFIKQYALGNAV